MSRHCYLIPVAAMLLVGLAQAQPPQFPQPQPEHAFLEHLAGKWDSVAEMRAGEGQPSVKGKSVIDGRMIGKFWVVNDIKGDFGGMNVTARQTIGYDTKKKKYISTWIDSMLDHMWHYEGTVDASGKVLTFETEGPNFMTGQGTAKFRDVHAVKSKDKIVVTSYVQDAQGEWIEYVRSEMTRQAEPASSPAQ